MPKQRNSDKSQIKTAKSMQQHAMDREEGMGRKKTNKEKSESNTYINKLSGSNIKVKFKKRK